MYRSVLLLVQEDITLHQRMHSTLVAMSESQLSLLSGIFPRHVVEHLAAASSDIAQQDPSVGPEDGRPVDPNGDGSHPLPGVSGSPLARTFDHLARLHENVSCGGSSQKEELKLLESHTSEVRP